MLVPANATGPGSTNESTKQCNISLSPPCPVQSCGHRSSNPHLFSPTTSLPDHQLPERPGLVGACYARSGPGPRWPVRCVIGTNLRLFLAPFSGFDQGAATGAVPYRLLVRALPPQARISDLRLIFWMEIMAIFSPLCPHPPPLLLAKGGVRSSTRQLALCDGTLLDQRFERVTMPQTDASKLRPYVKNRTNMATNITAHAQGLTLQSSVLYP